MQLLPRTTQTGSAASMAKNLHRDRFPKLPEKLRRVNRKEQLLATPIGKTKYSAAVSHFWVCQDWQTSAISGEALWWLKRWRYGWKSYHSGANEKWRWRIEDQTNWVKFAFCKKIYNAKNTFVWLLFSDVFEKKYSENNTTKLLM